MPQLIFNVVLSEGSSMNDERISRPVIAALRQEVEAKAYVYNGYELSKHSDGRVVVIAKYTNPHSKSVSNVN